MKEAIKISHEKYGHLIDSAAIYIFQCHGIKITEIPQEDIARNYQLVERDLGNIEHSYHIIDRNDGKVMGAFRYRSEYDPVSGKLLLIADDFRIGEA